MASGACTLRWSYMLYTNFDPQFPIGMGTGAVYLTLSSLKYHSPVLTTVETIFYALNIILFLTNSSTLLIQAIREYLSNPHHKCR